MDDVTIPTLYPIKQSLPKGEPIDIERVLEADFARLGLAAQVKGKRIALGFGSRGIASIDRIAGKLVALVKAAGGAPFIVPAMGSHGGGTPAGQIDVLDGLGISEATMGCPIQATMEVVDTGMTGAGLPAYLDKNVAEADGLIITNRTKVHTDFHGPHESGLLKMLAVGLGQGGRAPAPFISRAWSACAIICPSSPNTSWRRATSSPASAWSKMATTRWRSWKASAPIRSSKATSGSCSALASSCRGLPVDDIDVLIIDEMGKNISGAGMDTNIIGRWMVEGEPEPESPRIKRIAILDLTPESHGNATTYGLADFMSRKLFDKIDFPITTKNMFTSGFLLRCRMPLVFESDEETIKAALFDAFRSDPSQCADARVVRIKNTLASGECLGQRQYRRRAQRQRRRRSGRARG